MWTAFPPSDYYGLSAPFQGHQLTVDLPVTPRWMRDGKGEPGMVPTFTMYRLTRWVPSSSPATSFRVRRRLSSKPPHRLVNTGFGAVVRFSMRVTFVADRPISTRLESAKNLRRFNH